MDCRPRSAGRRLSRILIAVLLTLFACCCLYPLWYLLLSTVSDMELFQQHDGLLLWPVTAAGEGLQWDGWYYALHGTRTWTGLANSLLYAAVGALLHVVLCAVAAYCITRRGTLWMRYFALLCLLAGLLSPGLIPTYTAYKRLGLYNNRWVMVLIDLLPLLHIGFVAASMRALPRALEEAAQLDGAGALTYLTRIVPPLVKPSLAAAGLLFALARWNDYLTGAIYLLDPNLFPIQLLTRQYLIEALGWTPEVDSSWRFPHCVSLLAVLPPLLLAPLATARLKKGLQLGAVKS